MYGGTYIPVACYTLINSVIVAGVSLKAHLMDNDPTVTHSGINKQQTIIITVIFLLASSSFPFTA